MRVILVDDHRVFLDSFRIALEEEQSIQVVGQTWVGRDAQQLAITLKPDLMVLDLMLGDMDAVKLTRQLRAKDLPTRIMILSVHNDSLFVRDAFDAGAQGYALKDQPLAEVIEAMHTVERGERYLAPRLGPLPAPSSRAARKAGDPARDRLSHREREIFGLIVQGHSSRDIAEALTISLKTVETHRAHINKKLGVRSPAELIRVAALQGLVLPEAKRADHA
jgi:DNA-binding NarL/FixJ family response regulator